MQVVVPVALLAVALAFIGTWGRRHAAELAVVPGMEPARVARRARVMRRGAVACTALGVVFLLVALAAALFGTG